MDVQHGTQRPTTQDGREVAQRTELKVLRTLSRFGWLKTRSIAAIAWQPWAEKAPDFPDISPCQPPASALRMAQRTLKRMTLQRKVLKAKGPDGGPIYALAETGARTLRELGIKAESGKDLLRKFSASHFRHRCIANDLAIAGILQGYRVSTEREIARGLWPGGESGIFGKKPDALLRSGSQWYWIEVERSARNARDKDALLKWLGHMRQHVFSAPAIQIAPGASLARIIFVCRVSFKNKLEHDLLALGWTRKQISELIMFETALYSLEDFVLQ